MTVEHGGRDVRHGAVRVGLEALAALGVPFVAGPEQRLGDGPALETDVYLAEGDVAAADRALRAAGLRFHPSPMARGHRLYLAFDRVAARWLKVDVKPVRGPAVPGLGSWGAAAVRRLRHERNGPGGGLLDRARSALDRHRPSGVWRAGR